MNVHSTHNSNNVVTMALSTYNYNVLVIKGGLSPH